MTAKRLEHPVPTFTPKSTSITFTVEVHDGEPIRLPYGSTYFRPDMATVTFTGDRSVCAEVAGPNVKKDGSDGLNRHDTRFWSADRMPDWVAQLVDDMRPAAQAAADRGPF